MGTFLLRVSMYESSYREQFEIQWHKRQKQFFYTWQQTTREHTPTKTSMQAAHRSESSRSPTAAREKKMPRFVVIKHAVAIFCTALPWSSSLSAQNQMPEAIHQKTVSQINRFIEHFIDANKTAAEQAALFTEDVEYYDHGAVSRTHIMRDIERYARRWPEREYILSGIHYIRADPDSDRVFVSYEIAYTVANREKKVSGKAIYGAVITDLEHVPRVEWIKEKVQGKS